MADDIAGSMSDAEYESDLATPPLSEVEQHALSAATTPEPRDVDPASTREVLVEKIFVPAAVAALDQFQTRAEILRLTKWSVHHATDPNFPNVSKRLDELYAHEGWLKQEHEDRQTKSTVAGFPVAPDPAPEPQDDLDSEGDEIRQEEWRRAPGETVAHLQAYVADGQRFLPIATLKLLHDFALLRAHAPKITQDDCIDELARGKGEDAAVTEFFDAQMLVGEFGALSRQTIRQRYGDGQNVTDPEMVRQLARVQRQRTGRAR